MRTTRQKTGKTRETKNHDADTISATTPPGSMPRLPGDLIAASDRKAWDAAWAKLTPQEQRALLANWPAAWARPDQLPPDGDWTTWLMLGGRGAGKTRAGAEWVRALVLASSAKVGGEVERIALVGETLADVRDVMVHGELGLMSLDWGSGRKSAGSARSEGWSFRTARSRWRFRRRIRKV